MGGLALGAGIGGVGREEFLYRKVVIVSCRYGFSFHESYASVCGFDPHAQPYRTTCSLLEMCPIEYSLAVKHESFQPIGTFLYEIRISIR